MSIPAPASQRTVWSIGRKYPFSVLGGLVLLVLAIPFCQRQSSEWEEVYVSAARHLWRGEDIYQSGDGYLYPPFMAVTALPFLYLPPPLPRFLWFTTNVAALVAVLRWGWRLSGGEPLEGSTSGTGRERFAALVGCLCGISYLENCLAHQQTDIVIAALLVGGCLLLQRGRSVGAATLLGVAAACKCTALLWLPYFLWRGRPLAALWVVVVALGVNLLPDLIASSPREALWIENYAHSFLAPLTASNHYVGTWGSDPVYNQSLTGLAQRWCTTSWHWGVKDCTVDARVPLLQPQTLRMVVYGLELSLLVVVLWICGRPFQNISIQSNNGVQSLECCMVLLLMLLLSPMSSKAHFGTLLVPGFFLARAASHRRSTLLKVLVTCSVVLGLISNKDPLGERLYTLSLWYGIVTWQTLLLLAGCLFLYRRQRVSDDASLPCPAPGLTSHAHAA